MKVLKSTPGGNPCPANVDSPVPRTNKNKNGWISEVTARQAVAAKADQLALPDDENRSQVVPQPVFGQSHPDLGDQGGLGPHPLRAFCDLRRHPYRLPALHRAANWRIASLLEASASRIVEPV